MIFILIDFIKPGEFKKSNQIKIINSENSIFNGYTPLELSEKLAIVLQINPLRAKEEELHSGIKWFKYYYQQNSSIIITVRLKNNSLFSGLSCPFELTYGNIKLNSNKNSENITDSILNIWKDFLKSLDFQLKNDFSITLQTYKKEWKVIIRQLFNNNMSLINTGIIVNIEKNNLTIKNIKIYDWSRIKINKKISISINNAVDIINNENKDILTNKSDLNFNGYFFYFEKIYYYFDFEILSNKKNNISPITEVKTSIIYENGTEINILMEHWIGYDIYIDIEYGFISYNKYGISKPIENEL